MQALLEQEQTLEGELEVFYEDYEDHSKSRLQHVLNTLRALLRFTVLHNHQSTRFSRVQKYVRGWKFKDVADKLDALVVADEGMDWSVLAQDSTGTVTASTTTSSAALSNTFGEQRTLVLLVNFQDNPQQPWTIDEVQDMVLERLTTSTKRTPLVRRG